MEIIRRIVVIVGVAAGLLLQLEHRANADVPLIQFQSRELHEGRGYVKKLTAVLGVGESSGTLTYDYPIDIPKGRGVTPQIALEYSSQGHQSQFGWGWALTIPTIERDYRKGSPAAAQYYEYRNGHEVDELVYIKSSSGYDEYQELHQHTFSRYLFQESSNYWVVERTDGTTLYLGVDTSARRGDDVSYWGNTDTWLASHIFDTHDNEATYTYSPDGDGNARIAQIGYDANPDRGINPIVTVQFNWAPNWDATPGTPVPLSYRGGYLRTFGNDKLSTIVVTAPPHATGTNPAVVPASSPTTRTYSFTYQPTDGASGQDLMLYLVSAQVESEPAVTFAYSDPWGTGTDYRDHRGVGLQTYLNPDADGFPPYLIHQTINSSTTTTTTDMTVADVNSDGLTDFIDMSSGQPIVWLNDGMLGTTPLPTIDTPNLHKVIWQPLMLDQNWENPKLPANQSALRITAELPGVSADTTEDFFDLDGDGYPDIVYIANGSDLAYCPGTGSGFGACTLYTTQIASLRHEDRTLQSFSYTTSEFADFNGDGRPDWLSIDPGGNLTVNINNGPGLLFTQMPTITLPLYSGNAGLRVTQNVGGTDINLVLRCELKDVNGDGLPDFLTTDQNGSIYAYYNVGGVHFSTTGTLLSGVNLIGGGHTSNDSSALYASFVDLVDMNGDGLPDVVDLECTGSQTTVSVKYNNGGTWDQQSSSYTIASNPNWDYDLPCMNSSQMQSGGLENVTTSYLADFNGDGLPDFASADKTPNWPHHNVIIRSFVYNAPRMMESATSLSGNSTMTVGYAPIHAAYLGSTPGPPFVIHAPFTLTRSRTALYSQEPTQQTTLTTTYSYGAPHFDRIQRMFTGFDGVEKWDDTFGADTLTTYGSDFNTQGLVLERMKSNQPLSIGATSDTVYSYSEQPVNGGTWERLDQIDAKSTYSNTRDEVTTYTYLQSPQYGKPTSWVEKGDPNDTNDDITHTVSYALRDDDSFIIDAPCLTSASSTEGGQASATRTYYDNTTLCAAPTYGDVTSVQHEANGGPFSRWVSKSYIYDSTGFGLVTQMTDEAGAITTYTYDTTYNLYPVRTIQKTSPYNLVTFKSFHALTGQAADVCGPQYDVDTNSYRCSRTEIDSLGREIASYVPYFNVNTDEYELRQIATVTYDDVDYPLVETRTEQAVDVPASRQIQYLDGFGNPTEERIEKTSNNFRVYETGYDAFGNPLRTELPRIEGGTAYTHTPISTEGWTYQSDYVNGNIEAITYPRDSGDNSPPAVKTRIVHEDHVAITDEDDREVDYNWDFFGRVASIDRIGGADGTAHTAFTYDTGGHILSATDPTPAHLVTSYQRNLLGWVTSRTTPDGQVMHYPSYNARGQVLTSLDPRGVTATYTYDTLGRLVEVATSGEPAGVRHVDDTWTYEDGSHHTTQFGWLTQETSDGNLQEYTYNALGEMESIGAYDSNWDGVGVSLSYDTAGRTTSVYYNDNNVVSYLYNLDDTVQEMDSGAMPTLLASFSYNPDGQLASLANCTPHCSLPFGLTETNSYDARGRTKEVMSSNSIWEANNPGNGALVDDKVTLSKASLVQEIDRYGVAPGGAPRLNTPDVYVMTPDGFGRLKHVDKNGAQFGDYGYDLAGRLMQFNEGSNAGTASTTTNYDMITSRTLDTDSWTWTYDAAGNVTHDEHDVSGSLARSRDHEWDALGRYVQTTDSANGTTTYDYTATGQLARVTYPGESQTTTDMLQIGSWAEFDLSTLNTTGAETDHIVVNGQAIADYEDDYNSDDHFQIPHRTYDGTVLAVTDDQGSIVRQEEFTPYGATVTEPGSSGDGAFEQHFQGSRTDKLMVAGTRAYDAFGGMWLGRDPLALASPESLISDSRLGAVYGFDNGNPATFRDPSGNEGEDSPVEVPTQTDDDGGYEQNGVHYTPDGKPIVETGNDPDQRMDSDPNSTSDSAPSDRNRNGAIRYSGSSVPDLPPGLGEGACRADGTDTDPRSSIQSVPIVRGGRGPVVQGATGVERAIRELRAMGVNVLGTDITIEANGVRTKPDILAESGGIRFFVEVKTGPTADLTRNQRIAFPAIEASGGIPYGGNAKAAGLEPGALMPATPIIVLYYP